MTSFERGDIIVVGLDSSLDKKDFLGESRAALVLSTKAFNALGNVLVAPITQGGDHSRFAGFAVSLDDAGCKTNGYALVSNCRMVDLSARNVQWVEQAPQDVVDDALGRLTTIF